MKDRRQVILDTAADLMSDFIYYDRKEDAQLHIGEIGEALRNGETSIPEIMQVFRKALETEMATRRGG